MRLLAVIVAALVLSACGPKPTHSAASTTTPTATAGLDCAKPANGTQQLVCNDPQLTDLDRQLQAAYQQALARPGADQAALTAAQNNWATVRDGCAQNADMHTCVLEAYQTRLVQLAIADPATVAPPVVAYQCPADFGPLDRTVLQPVRPADRGAQLERKPRDPFHPTVRQWGQVRPPGFGILGAPGRGQARPRRHQVRLSHAVNNA